MRLNIKPAYLFAALLGSTVTLTASAGPGDGTVVVIDHLRAPDIVISELREENYDASHAPIKVRIAVPKTEDGEDSPMQWARVTAYLTSVLSDPDAPHLTEVTVNVGPEWANRSLLIEVPSPGAGEYFVHIDAKLRLTGQESVEIHSTTTQPVRFGTPNICDSVEDVLLPGIAANECPLLFATKSATVLSGGRLGPKNEQVLDTAVQVINDLCTANSLHRVSVRGWASTLNSNDPPNEVLAQQRAEAVVSALQDLVPECKVRIQNDSPPGTRAVTKEFGQHDAANQCAQIHISRHTCTGSNQASTSATESAP